MAKLKSQLMALKTRIFSSDIISNVKNDDRRLVTAGYTSPSFDNNKFQEKKIVQSASEYWDYLLSKSTWKGTKEGLLIFLLQMFQEIKERSWNTVDINHMRDENNYTSLFAHIGDASPENNIKKQQNEDNLYQPLALIQNSLEQLRQLVVIVESEEIYLDKEKKYIKELKHVIGKCLMSNPVGATHNFSTSKYSQELKNLRITQEYLQNYIRKSEMRVKEEYQVEFFYEKIQQHLISKHLSIQQFYATLTSSGSGGAISSKNLLGSEQEIYLDDTSKKYYYRDQFCGLFEGMIEEHNGNEELEEEQKVTYEDTVKYFNLVSKDNGLQVPQVNIHKFEKQLMEYVGSSQKKVFAEKLELQNQQASFQVYARQYLQYISEDLDCRAKRQSINGINQVADQMISKLLSEESSQLTDNLLSEMIIEARSFRKETVEFFHLFIQRAHQQVEEEKDQKVRGSLMQELKKFCANYKLYRILFMYLYQTREDFTAENLKMIHQLLTILLILAEIDIASFQKNFIAFLEQNQEISLIFFSFVSRIFSKVDHLLTTPLDVCIAEKQKQKIVVNLSTKTILQVLRISQKLNQSSNYKAQQYLRKQDCKTDEQYVSVDILNEVLHFSSNFHYYIYKGSLQSQQIFSEIDVLTVYTQCFKSLDSFCTGQEAITFENQQIVINHASFVTFIQYVLANSKYDILSSNIQDTYYKIAFESCLQLLLTLQQGIKLNDIRQKKKKKTKLNPNTHLENHPETHPDKPKQIQIKKDLMIVIFKGLNLQTLFAKAIHIYEQIIHRRKDIILQGKTCLHTSNPNCTDTKCEDHFVTKHEESLYHICFSVIIFFKVLSDIENDIKYIDLFDLLQGKVESNESNEQKKVYWTSLKGAPTSQKSQTQSYFRSNLKFIKLYINLQDYIQSKDYDSSQLALLHEYIRKRNDAQNFLELEEKNQITKIGIKKYQNQIENNSHQANTKSNFKAKKKFHESFYKIRQPNQKNLLGHHDKKAQEQEELVPLKQVKQSRSSDMVEENDQTVRTNMYKIQDAVIDWYEEVQVQSSENNRKKQWCCQMANVIAFFGKFISQIEVNPNQQKFYFTFPFSSSFLSQETINNVMEESEKLKETGEEMYKRLIPMSIYFNEEVEFRQRISQNGSLNFILYYLDLFKSIQFVIVMAINILYLIYLIIDNSDESTFQTDYIRWINVILIILQLLFAFIILLIESVNKYPQISFRIKEKLQEQSNQFQFQTHEFNQNVQQEDFKQVNVLQEVYHSKSLFSHLLNFDMIYYTLYLLVSIISVFSLPFASTLMFDIVKRNQPLQQVLKVIAINAKQLCLILMLAITILYCFSFIGFSLFWEHFPELIKDRQFYFYHIFAYLVQVGFKNPSSLGDAMKMEDIDDKRQYWQVYFFVWLFYLIMGLFFFTLVVGLISGTFSQMKSSTIQRNETYKKCRICGQNQEEFERKQVWGRYTFRNMDWYYHITYEHSLPSYLFFIIQLKNKDYSECNETEKSIKAKIECQDMTWLPIKK